MINDDKFFWIILLIISNFFYEKDLKKFLTFALRIVSRANRVVLDSVSPGLGLNMWEKPH